MDRMRIPVWLVLVGAVIALAVGLVVGQQVLDPNTALIQAADFAFEVITPNADGDADIVPFNYTLSRPAAVSLTFENSDGLRFVFREGQARDAGEYSVLFSGVVEGFSLPEDDFPVIGTIERRLIPDGVYTWTLVADGLRREESETVTGTLTVADGDKTLPLITSFVMSSEAFTPNQDGVRDRVGISAVVLKEANITAQLLGDGDQRYTISARADILRSEEGFRHEFDYEGGVDIGADPPPDGTYTVRVAAQDPVGQRVAREAELTIEKGGKPYAEIIGQPVGPDVVFEVRPYDERYYSDADGLGDLVAPPEDQVDVNFTSLPVPVGDLLVFKLVVENYGASPIRTSGPPPGTVYQQTQLYASMGQIGYQQSGVWRVGIQCETASDSFPWRWALGDESTLTTEHDPISGNTYLYLMPGERAVVWGAVRMTQLVPTFNPQNCYAGLIHEGVNISVRNAVVGSRSILLQSPEQTATFNTGD